MGRFKMSSGRVCAAALTIVVSALGACAVGPAGSSSNETRPDQRLLCEPGLVEAERAVISGSTGVGLGKGITLDSGGLYQPIPEADMVSGMTSAASVALAYSDTQSASTGRVGTAYMIRLQCGGVIYAFEHGSQRFSAGSRVSVQHGLTPSLLPR
jgi:hypothetical protein